MALYPPIIDSSKAMQLISDNNSDAVKVYYKSKNTDEMEAAYYLASAIHPRTGDNVLDSGEMALCEKKSDNNGAYVEVALANNKKIAQITLYAVKAGTVIPEAANIRTWYLNNKNSVSVSSVAVIFKLFNTTIDFCFPEDDDDKKIDSLPFNFTMNIDFTDPRPKGEEESLPLYDTDNLKWYQIQLFDSENQELANTQRVYPTTLNVIDTILNYDFFATLSDASYTIKVTICTCNGVVKEETSNGWSVEFDEAPVLTSQWSNTFTFGKRDSIIDVKYTSSTSSISGSISAALYRHVKENTWEKIGETQTNTVENNSVIFSFNISSYFRAAKYKVLIGKDNLWHQASNEFWHAAYGQDILLKQDEQTSYLIKYNPEINQVKRNIVDIITPTLGAKYPFVYRNGHQNYRTFTIGGLIARYDNTKGVAYIGTDEDIIQERLYREDLLDFLYNDKVKLFSSAQEGEMLIKLSGVSVTPMKQLGRMLYSFSATATEIADCTKDNLEVFGIEG